MIGKQIKSYQHLSRALENGFSKVMVTFNDTCMGQHKFFHIIDVLKYEDKIYFFFDRLNEHIDFSNIVDDETYKQIQSLGLNCACHFRDEFKKTMFRYVYLLPKTFDSDFDHFCQTNKSLVSKVKGSDDIKKMVYALTDGSKNYFAWAINLIHRISHIKLLMVLQWAKNNKHLAKLLSKGGITAYKNKEINSLCAEIHELNFRKRINDAINMFNTSQKKLLKTNLENLSNEDKQSLSRFLRMSTTKRQNLIQKVSTINDFVELTDFIKASTKVSFKWDMDSFMRNIDELNDATIRIAIKGDNFVVVEVLDFEAIKFLGKNTNWCIAKDKGSWSGYTTGGERRQYILFDFSKKEDDDLSIIGFTTIDGFGVRHAHSLTNKDLYNVMDGGEFSDYGFVTYSNNEVVEHINTLLNMRGIDINMLCKMRKLPFSWNRKSVLSAAYNITEDIDIIKETNEHLVFATYVKDFHNVFLSDPSNLKKRVSTNYMLVFCDFTEPVTQGLIIALIEQRFGSRDQATFWYNYALNPINKDINVVLHKYNLPYDTIKRPNDLVTRFKEGFIGCNMTEVRECMAKDKNILDKALPSLQNEMGTLFEVFRHVSFDLKSFDYLNLVYGNGHTLNDFIGSTTLTLLRAAITSIYEIPDDKSIELFFSKKVNDTKKHESINSFLIIENILNNEKNHTLILRFLEVLDEYLISNDVKVKLWEMSLDKLKSLEGFESIKEEAIKTLYPYAPNSKSDVINEFFSDVQKKINLIQPFDYHGIVRGRVMEIASASNIAVDYAIADAAITAAITRENREQF